MTTRPKPRLAAVWTHAGQRTQAARASSAPVILRSRRHARREKTAPQRSQIAGSASRPAPASAGWRFLVRAKPRTRLRISPLLLGTTLAIEAEQATSQRPAPYPAGSPRTDAYSLSLDIAKPGADQARPTGC